LPVPEDYEIVEVKSARKIKWRIQRF
jgi:hypothetical protein